MPGLRCEADDPEFEIHTTGLPQFQGKGIGSVLMDQLVHAADQYDGPIFLEVPHRQRTPRSRCMRSTVSTGWSVRKNYKPSGADAYTMQRPRLSERKNL